MISEESHALFQELIKDASRFVLVTHIHPDGDALGSQLSLASFLVSRGKRVRIINNDATPETLRFIERDELPVEVYEAAKHESVLRDADRVVLVDNSAPDRLGAMEPVMLRTAQRTLCIDHHPSRGTPWAQHILDEACCATSVMIFELARRCGWKPDLRAAEAIYVGLATDTGFFRFNSTNAQAHLIAAELLELGVEPARAFREVYERNSPAFTRLLGHAMAGLRLLSDDSVATVTIPLTLIESLDAGGVDTSEISTMLLAIDGIRAALLFRELPGGRIKVSLRSKGDLDVHRLAGEFGGGGHRNASGIVMDGRLDDVFQIVTERTVSLLAGKR